MGFISTKIFVGIRNSLFGSAVERGRKRPVELFGSTADKTVPRCVSCGVLRHGGQVNYKIILRVKLGNQFFVEGCSLSGRESARRGPAGPH